MTAEEGAQSGRTMSIVLCGCTECKTVLVNVIIGTVVDGKIVVEAEPLTDGSKVTVIALDEEETFELSPQQEAEILIAISEIEQSKGIEGRRFLEELERET